MVRLQFCPECGGDLVYEPTLKMYACKGCGLFATREQISDLRVKVVRDEDQLRKKRRQQAEYLEWWLSKK